MTKYKFLIIIITMMMFVPAIKAEGTPCIEFYDAWVNDNRVDVGSPVTIIFKARWNDSLQLITDGIYITVTDGEKNYHPSLSPYGMLFHATYDKVCQMYFRVISVQYWGNRTEFHSGDAPFIQTVDNPKVIWDQILFIIPKPDATTTTESTAGVPEDHTLLIRIAIAPILGVIIVAVAVIVRERRNP